MGRTGAAGERGRRRSSLTRVFIRLRVSDHGYCSSPCRMVDIISPNYDTTRTFSVASRGDQDLPAVRERGLLSGRRGYEYQRAPGPAGLGPRDHSRPSRDSCPRMIGSSGTTPCGRGTWSRFHQYGWLEEGSLRKTKETTWERRRPRVGLPVPGYLDEFGIKGQRVGASTY